MFRLRRAPGALPLAFQVQDAIETGELGGNLREPLESYLAREGIGLKTITVNGKWPSHAGAVRLSSWSQTIEVAGTLDVEGFIRLIHQMARQFIGGFAKNNSPQEIYITEIIVTGEGPAEKKRRMIRYRDTRTGHFVSKATWQRSRRQLKGKRGRYVRTVYTEYY